MDPTKILFFAQIVIQVLLLILVVVLIAREKKQIISAKSIDNLKKVIDDTQQLSDDFSHQITERIDLVKKIMAEMEAKITEAQQIKSALETLTQNLKKMKTFNKDDVLKLHESGFDPQRISQITGIPTGEVELIVKIKKNNTLET